VSRCKGGKRLRYMAKMKGLFDSFAYNMESCGLTAK
jgi:hypothetical protein